MKKYLRAEFVELPQQLTGPTSLRWVTGMEYLGALLINCTQASKAPEMLNLAYILRMSYLDRTLGLLEKTLHYCGCCCVYRSNSQRVWMEKTETSAAALNLRQ